MSASVARSSCIFLLCTGLLAGCSATNPNILKRYDAANSARVRIFVYSADRIRLDFDRTCYSTPGMLGHGDGLEAIQRSRLQGSRSIGMPPTSQPDDWIYDEFIITAGIPITVFGKVGGRYAVASGGSGTAWRHFGPESRDAGYFTAGPGKDYEVYVDKRKVIVEEMGTSGLKDSTRFVHLEPAKACAPEGGGRL